MNLFKSIIFIMGLFPVVLLAESDPEVYPQQATMNLLLNEEPEHNNFTRYLVFKNYFGDTVNVPFDFTKKSDLEYEAVITDSSEGYNNLYELCRNGNRNFWDWMRLENQGGSTLLSIKHLFFEIVYNKGAGIKTIPIINWDVNKILAEGNSHLDLNGYARSSRVQWVQDEVKRITGIDYIYDATMSPAFLASLLDIGKCGTSGVGDDEYGYNSKYGSGKNLCSEFVSWYYANHGTSFGKLNFYDIKGHKALSQVFESNNRLYDYDSVTNQFQNSVTGEVYEPRPGDYLRRDDLPNPDTLNDGHSMMIAGWNPETGMAAVVNGPWPVTVRQVNVSSLEGVDHHMQVGRVSEFTSSLPVTDLVDVYFRDEGMHEQNAVKPRIYIQNKSSSPVCDFIVHYTFTIDTGKVPVLETYYVPNAAISLEQVSSTTYRIIYDYTGITLDTADVIPDINGSSVALHYDDWSTWDKSDDPSYIASETFIINDKIEVFDSNGNSL